MSAADDLQAVEQAIEQCIAYERQTFGGTLGDLFAQASALRAQVAAQQGYAPAPGAPAEGGPTAASGPAVP